MPGRLPGRLACPPSLPLSWPLVPLRTCLDPLGLPGSYFSNLGTLSWVLRPIALDE